MIRRARIKLCGVTRLEDATMAVELGVAAIGFVFAATSKRRISAEGARAIVDRIHPLVATVGVFANQSVSEVRQLAVDSGVSLVQLHGDETQSFIDELGLPAIKAISVLSPAASIEASAFTCRGILFDGPRGGSGVAFDSALLEGAPMPASFGVAGGLNAENVFEVVTRLSPHWVDVASGVESSPGIKDLRMLERFVRAIDGDHR